MYFFSSLLFLCEGFVDVAVPLTLSGYWKIMSLQGIDGD